jgi:hypothetical protein
MILKWATKIASRYMGEKKMQKSMASEIVSRENYYYG